MAYSYKGLLSNEFKGLVFTCVSEGGLVPVGPTYQNQSFQSCTLAGHREVGQKMNFYLFILFNNNFL